ncbi:MAG: response regulator [Acidobacteriota bacterium]
MKSPAPSNSSNILLVDDNKLGLAARKSVLEEQGHHITTATAGEEAFELFRRGQFDLLITDYKMPGMNGVELIKKVRAHSPQVPVILVSGYAEALGLTEASTGADVVIPKSANEVSHLVRSVGRLLRRKPAKKPVLSHHPPTKARRAGA